MKEIKLINIEVEEDNYLNDIANNSTLYCKKCKKQIISFYFNRDKNTIECRTCKIKELNVVRGKRENDKK